MFGILIYKLSLAKNVDESKKSLRTPLAKELENIITVNIKIRCYYYFMLM